jgi:hypothetical protein
MRLSVSRLLYTVYDGMVIECGAICGMRYGSGNKSTLRQPSYPPQIPHHLNRYRSRASAVGSQGLSVCVIVWKKNYAKFTFYNLFSHLDYLCGLVVSSWLEIQRARVRFPVLPDFLRSSGSGTGVHSAS